jgi:L-arabinose isomerase
MGFLGHTYPGMLDMYSDFTMIEAQAGLHVEILEMCDVLKLSRDVTEKQELDKLRQVEEMFIISEDSPTDPLVRKPDGDQLRFSCRVAVALEKLVKEFELDALTYFYRGRENNDYQRLQESSTLGYSLLTAQGIPCSGEGDMKTAIAMKVSDTLGVGGSFSEIVACDYYLNTIILGHDGPFHIEISAGKPILRGMQLYHGKTGQGISVEAAVRQGPVTLLNITQTHDGRMRAIVNQGEAVTGPLLQIGNTMTHIRFTKNPTEMMNAWFSLAPTHHCALSVGYNLTVLEKVAIFMSWPCTSLSHENRV